VPASANNQFGRAVLLGVPATAKGNTNTASTEVGEPKPCGPIGRTVWFKVTATDTTLSASTIDSGTTFDTVLAIYSGGSLASLTTVGCNDDAGGTGQSQVSASGLTPGQTYYIQVGGYRAAGGNYVLKVSGAAAAASVSAPAPGGVKSIQSA
jgi:hypothetical protein